MRFLAPNPGRRTASVLVLTLVVVSLLTLGAAAFFERMFAEHRAGRTHGRQLQARQLAESGVEYIKALLMQDPLTIDESGGLYANPDWFQGVLVIDDPIDAFRGRFTILAPDLTTYGRYGGFRYGLENESSRLNLNTVLMADSSANPTGARNLLMTLPGMTESIADAILDWIDSDDEPRELGAEGDYYSSLDPPYQPRNGPLGSLDELLLVREVTPALLYGADLNRNTMIDGIEEPLTTIDNVDNSLGLLNRGWSAYLTLDSCETNLRPDGRPKIDVNKDDLKELHKELTEVFDQEMANFIVAYRQGGRFDGEGTGQQAGSIQIDFTQPGRQKLTTILDLIGVRTRIAKSTTGQNNGSTNQTSTGRSASGNGQQSNSDRQSGGRAGGENASGGRNNGTGDSRIIVEAAFPEREVASYITKLMDNLTVNPQPTIPGRLNINQAPRRLLSGIPYLSEAAIDQIVANRDVTLGQQRPEQTHETWLLTDDIVDLETMKKLMPLVTTGGSVYRAQVVGFFDAEGPADRLEVVIDAIQTPPLVRRRWELRELGPGYSLEILGGQPEDPR